MINGKMSRFWDQAVTQARQWFDGEPPTPQIGLALGGGFARGITHVGVLRVFEQNGIEIKYLSGVSAGSIVAAGYASGTPLPEIEQIARKMRFKDVASWTPSKLALADSVKMTAFLQRLLKVHNFEDMVIPLAVVASDLATGDSAVFRGKGDALLPIRASCAYPGMFPPIRLDGKVLVDGMVTMDVPAPPLRTMGATHVIAISLPSPAAAFDPQDMLSVVSRSFQILTQRTESQWRRSADLVLTPDVRNMGWDGFDNADKLIEAGEKAARAALPIIQRWFAEARPGESIAAHSGAAPVAPARISLRLDD